MNLGLVFHTLMHQSMKNKTQIVISSDRLTVSLNMHNQKVLGTSPVHYFNLKCCRKGLCNLGLEKCYINKVLLTKYDKCLLEKYPDTSVHTSYAEMHAPVHTHV